MISSVSAAAAPSEAVPNGPYAAPVAPPGYKDVFADDIDCQGAALTQPSNLLPPPLDPRRREFTADPDAADMGGTAYGTEAALGLATMLLISAAGVGSFVWHRDRQASKERRAMARTANVEHLHAQQTKNQRNIGAKSDVVTAAAGKSAAQTSPIVFEDRAKRAILDRALSTRCLHVKLPQAGEPKSGLSTSHSFSSRHSFQQDGFADMQHANFKFIKPNNQSDAPIPRSGDTSPLTHPTSHRNFEQMFHCDENDSDAERLSEIAEVAASRFIVPDRFIHPILKNSGKQKSLAALRTRSFTALARRRSQLFKSSPDMMYSQEVNTTAVHRKGDKTRHPVFGTAAIKTRWSRK